MQNNFSRKKNEIIGGPEFNAMVRIKELLMKSEQKSVVLVLVCFIEESWKIRQTREG